jgi:hypothetical protein
MSKAVKLYLEAERRAQTEIVHALLRTAVFRHAAHGKEYHQCGCEVCRLRKQKYYVNLHPIKTYGFTKKGYINHIKRVIANKMQQGIID